MVWHISSDPKWQRANSIAGSEDSESAMQLQLQRDHMNTGLEESMSLAVPT